MKPKYIQEVQIYPVLGIMQMFLWSSSVRLQMSHLSLNLVTSSQSPGSHLVCTRVAHSPGGCICLQNSSNCCCSSSVMTLLRA